MVKLIFKAYIKKLIKYFLFFFPIYKNVNRILSKTKKGVQKGLVKGSKIFLKKKKTKSANDEKQRLVEYIKINLRCKNKYHVSINFFFEFLLSASGYSTK